MKTVYGLAIFITVFMLFTVGLSQFGTELATTPTANLDDASILYIAKYNGFQEDQFNVNTLGDDADLFNSQDNTSGEATVDFAQEYLFSLKTAEKSQQYVTTIVNVPDFMLLTFNQEASDWAEYLVIISAFITITIVVAFYLFIKGRATED